MLLTTLHSTCLLKWIQMSCNSKLVLIQIKVITTRTRICPSRCDPGHFHTCRSDVKICNDLIWPTMNNLICLDFWWDCHHQSYFAKTNPLLSTRRWKGRSLTRSLMKWEIRGGGEGAVCRQKDTMKKWWEKNREWDKKPQNVSYCEQNDATHNYFLKALKTSVVN